MILFNPKPLYKRFDAELVQKGYYRYYISDMPAWSIQYVRDRYEPAGWTVRFWMGILEIR